VGKRSSKGSRDISALEIPEEGSVISLGPAPDMAGVAERPDIREILEHPGKSKAQKRKEVLVALGLRTTKKKYKTPADRKKAAKERTAARKTQRLGILGALGLQPEKREKLTDEERKDRSKTARQRRTSSKRDFIRDMAERNPSLAKKYGIDISRFMPKKK